MRMFPLSTMFPRATVFPNLMVQLCVCCVSEGVQSLQAVQREGGGGGHEVVAGAHLSLLRVRTRPHSPQPGRVQER